MVVCRWRSRSYTLTPGGSWADSAPIRASVVNSSIAYMLSAIPRMSGQNSPRVSPTSELPRRAHPDCRRIESLDPNGPPGARRPRPRCADRVFDLDLTPAVLHANDDMDCSIAVRWLRPTVHDSRFREFVLESTGDRVLLVQVHLADDAHAGDVLHTAQLCWLAPKLVVQRLDGLDASRLLDTGYSPLDASLHLRKDPGVPATKLLEEIQVLLIDGLRGAQALSESVDLRRGELGHPCHSRN